ncbi:MAG: IS30 family transposase [Coriobacteriia bacterium]|nr:IS30 family transposase [Coriobacteriia bacterium]
MKNYPYFTKDELDDVWMRWKDGESQSDIARHYGVPPVYIFYRLRLHGGIKPAVQKPRAGSLAPDEREEISRGIASGQSIRGIARSIKRAPSTVSREISRNGGRTRYRAAKAQDAQYARARRPKQTKLAGNPRLLDYVTSRLEQDWSPEQIAGRLKVSFPDDGSMRISHETIYKSLYIQARRELRRGLAKHLRTGRIMRRSKRARPGVPARSTIKDAVPVSERPPEADGRAIPGHWEGDLIIGSKASQVATVVERASRFTMLIKCERRDASTVKQAVAGRIKALPKDLRRSLTWDRGAELAQHKELSLDANIDIYFCDPKSPWQRPTNENTNGLVRQYLPKRTDLSGYTQADLDAIAEKLNTRPRKVLGFMTPAAKLEEVLQ